MIIDCIADLHGAYPILEGGDLLIVAGDLTARDTEDQHLEFIRWIHEQKYKKKVFIAGNHDNRMVSYGWDAYDYSYLCDSGTEFESLKIWGSPWSRWFEEINPHCTAFTLKTEEELGEKWALIPDDVDILITHSPPFTVLDSIKDGRQVGSSTLMAEHLYRLRPKLWVFGHIHESYGIIRRPFRWNNTKYVNASIMNEKYDPVNKPIRVIL